MNNKVERTIDEKKKGKAGKYCPIRTLSPDGKERACGNYCAWFCEGLNSCVLHGINNNLRLSVQKPKN